MDPNESENENEPTAGICGECGNPVAPNTTPVTIGGWYNGHLYRWINGRLTLLAVRCESCRAEMIEREIQ